jgi:hypothetical protein
MGARNKNQNMRTAYFFSLPPLLFPDFPGDLSFGAFEGFSDFSSAIQRNYGKSAAAAER